MRAHPTGRGPQGGGGARGVIPNRSRSRSRSSVPRDLAMPEQPQRHGDAAHPAGPRAKRGRLVPGPPRPGPTFPVTLRCLGNRNVTEMPPTRQVEGRRGDGAGPVPSQTRTDVPRDLAVPEQPQRHRDAGLLGLPSPGAADCLGSSQTRTDVLRDLVVPGQPQRHGDAVPPGRSRAGGATALGRSRIGPDRSPSRTRVLRDLVVAGQPQRHRDARPPGRPRAGGSRALGRSRIGPDRSPSRTRVLCHLVVAEQPQRHTDADPPGKAEGRARGPAGAGGPGSRAPRVSRPWPGCPGRAR